jgi:hypothetical protein
MIYNQTMPHRKPIKAQLKSEQLMFRASKKLAQEIRKAAARDNLTVAAWIRWTLEKTLADAAPATVARNWEEQIEKLAASGQLIRGTKEKPDWLRTPPPGPGPAGVLDALLEERRAER